MLECYDVLSVRIVLFVVVFGHMFVILSGPVADLLQAVCMSCVVGSVEMPSICGGLGAKKSCWAALFILSSCSCRISFWEN